MALTRDTEGRRGGRGSDEDAWPAAVQTQTREYEESILLVKFCLLKTP